MPQTMGIFTATALASIWGHNMATKQSKLIVSLVDGITAPARKAAQGLLGIPTAARKANGQMTTFSERMAVAVRRNNEAIENMRGRMVEAVAGAYTLRAAFTGTAGAAMALEDKMADIAKVSDMNATELKAFETRLRRIATSEIPMAVEELGELAAAAAQSGIASKDLEEFTIMAAKSGVAWGMSGEQTGEALAKIKTALGLTIDETRSYADTINYLSDSSASKASDLVEFSRRVAADGKIAGFAKEEVLALGAAMISSGAEADVAATSLRNVGKMLSRGDFGAKKSQLEAFAQLGVDAEKVAKAMQVDAGGTLMTVLQAIKEAPPHMQAALASGIFGDEARALTPLLGELDATREKLKAVADETNYLGSVQKEFETRSKTGRYALQRFKNQLRDVAIVIGQALLPGMKVLLETMAPYLAKISELISQNPRLVAGIAAAASAFVALRIAMTGLAFVGLMGRGGVLSAIAMGSRMVGASAGGLWGAARASVALQTALGAMAGGQTLSVLGKISAGARGMLFAVPGVSMIASAISAIGAAVATISAPVWGLFAAIAAAVAATGLLLYKNWDRVSSVLSGVGQAIGEILAPAIEAIRPALDWLAPIGDVIASGWNSAKEAIAGVGEWVGKLFERDVLTDGDKAKYRQAGYDAIMALWDGMKQVAADLTQWVSGLAGRLGDTLAAIPGRIGRAVGLVSEPDSGDSGIDGARAKGGPIGAGKTYLVGEKGPELITPSKGGYVHPNGSGPAGASGGPISIAPQFNFYGTPRETADEIARKAVQLMEHKIRSLFSGAYADTGLHTSQ